MIKDLHKMEAYLRDIRIPLRLACATVSGWPMLVSLWFLFRGGKLMCATQRSARVVEYLRNDPRCAFEISADLPPYCGIRGQAKATVDEEFGAEVLEQLLVRYFGGIDHQLGRSLLAKKNTEVAIILEPKTIYTWDFSERMADPNYWTYP